MRLTMTPESVHIEYPWYAMNGQCLAVAVALAQEYSTSMLAEHVV